MNRPILSPLLAVACVAACALCLPGCDLRKPYRYEVRGTLWDYPTGARLVGARIEMASDGSIHERPDPVVSGRDGTFSFQFSVRDDGFPPDRMPKWTLTLTKEGYTTEVIDISPSKMPAGEETNQIIVAAFMR